MTSQEVVQFVELEIASRCRTLDDTVRGDWVRAVMKAGNVETAREIVRDMAEDPSESWMTVRSFYRRLGDRHRDEPQGKPEFVYGYDGAFDVVASCPRCDGRPDFCIRLAYPTALRYGNGVVRKIDWPEDRLREAMQSPFRQIRATYPGDWILSIWRAVPILPRPLDRDLGACKEAEARIMAGPDTPGKRWLLRNRGKDLVTAVAASLPESPRDPQANCATRADIEKLRQLEPVPTGGGPTRFDPVNDPELQD